MSNAERIRKALKLAKLLKELKDLGFTHILVENLTAQPKRFHYLEIQMTNVLPFFSVDKHVVKDTNLGVEWANEIIKKTNEPMSIDQIRAKFDPAIPFQVRCVRDVMPGKEDTPYFPSSIPVGTIVTVTGLPDKNGHYPTDYSGSGKLEYVLHPSLEKWVLV